MPSNGLVEDRYWILPSYNIAPVPHCGDVHWKLILVGSRFTLDAVSQYAPVEGEALALIYRLEQCRMFVLGCPNLIISVDNKPLVKIFGDQPLENVKNPRLQHFKEHAMAYKFRIKHMPGKLHLSADATS